MGVGFLSNKILLERMFFVYDLVHDEETIFLICCLHHLGPIDSGIFARILFSRIALKDILVMGENRD